MVQPAGLPGDQGLVWQRCYLTDSRYQELPCHSTNMMCVRFWILELLAMAAFTVATRSLNHSASCFLYNGLQTQTHVLKWVEDPKAEAAGRPTHRSKRPLVPMHTSSTVPRTSACIPKFRSLRMHHDNLEPETSR